MIILRKKYIYDKFGNIKDVQLEKKDYGHTFCDLVSECDIEGHEPERCREIEGLKTDVQMQRCKICRMVRSAKISLIGRTLNGILVGGYAPEIEYGDWYDQECYECEENCIISRPMDYFKCPNCHEAHESNEDKFNGFFHTNGDETLLFDCSRCNKKDQIIV